LSLFVLQPSWLQQILLRTDGTVTHILNAYTGEPIRVVKLAQDEVVWPSGDEALELSQDEEVLSRTVLLMGGETGRPLMFAHSLIVMSRISEEMVAALRGTDVPIGALLARHRAETFREILTISSEPAGGVSKHFAISPTADLFFRTYRIMVGGRPMMHITEKFPATAFQPATASLL
jgi:chorismate-pyruvate lyase